MAATYAIPIDRRIPPNDGTVHLPADAAPRVAFTIAPTEASGSGAATVAGVYDFAAATRTDLDLGDNVTWSIDRNGGSGGGGVTATLKIRLTGGEYLLRLAWDGGASYFELAGDYFNNVEFGQPVDFVDAPPVEEGDGFLLWSTLTFTLAQTPLYTFAPAAAAVASYDGPVLTFDGPHGLAIGDVIRLFDGEHYPVALVLAADSVVIDDTPDGGVIGTTPDVCRGRVRVDCTNVAHWRGARLPADYAVRYGPGRWHFLLNGSTAEFRPGTGVDGSLTPLPADVTAEGAIGIQADAQVEIYGLWSGGVFSGAGNLNLDVKGRVARLTALPAAGAYGTLTLDEAPAGAGPTAILSGTYRFTSVVFAVALGRTLLGGDFYHFKVGGGGARPIGLGL
jgi:hypothetical protein